jgi:hypothetical protein
MNESTIKSRKNKKKYKSGSGYLRKNLFDDVFRATFNSIRREIYIYTWMMIRIKHSKKETYINNEVSISMRINSYLSERSMNRLEFAEPINNNDNNDNNNNYYYINSLIQYL